jgi:WD40 repeat protein
VELDIRITGCTISRLILCLKLILGFDPRLRRVVVTSRSVFTMGNAGILQVWDKESGNEKLLQSYDVGFGIFAVAMSKDHLYIGGMVLQILEWDIETMLPLRNFLGHLNSVSYLLLVDQILYSGSRDYTLKSWDIQSASVIRDFFEPNDYAIYIAVSPEWLYSLGGDSGYLSRWNLTGGTRLFHMYAASDRSNANCMAITDDYILAGLASQIFIFRAGDLSLVTTLSPGKQLAPYAMIVNGDILYVGYVNGDVIIWNLYTFEQTFTIKGHSDYISSFEIDNNNLFSVSGDGTMKRWNLDNLRQSFTFRDRSNAITAIYLAEGKLWTGTLQGNVDVYDISTAFLVNTLEPKGGSIQIFFENKSGGLNALTEQGRVVDLKKRSAIAELSSDEIVVSSFFFREVLYFSDKSNHLKMWNSTEQLTPEIIFTSSQVSIVTITADEENVYVAQSDYVIMAIGRFDKAVLSKFIGHKGQVLCLISWGEYLLSSSDDKTIIMWQKSTGELRAQLSRSLNSLGHLGAVKYIVICESTLFSGGADNVVRQWNLESLSHEDVFVGHTKQVNVIMCHNSSFVFSGGDDQAIFMWAPKISRISEATRAATQLSGQSVARSRRAVFSVKANNIAANNIVIIVAVVSAVIAILALAVLILKLRKLNLWHSAKDFILNSNISDSTQSSPFAYDPTLLNTILGLSKPAYLLVKDEELIMERQIAKGGGGQVFIGRCLSKQAIGRSGRETIIVKKTANDYESLSKTQKSLFDQEVSLMEYLGAKDHIAKIIGYTNRPCCILMKFYPEGSLENWIEKLTPLLRAQFCLDIANGIFNMHSLLVAHCDLKPQNILIETIEYKGQCRPVCFLTDFGISNILSDTILSSRNFNVVNLRGLSVYYASPEAFSRFRQKLFSDSNRLKASDIYSFGAIAYHLLTRKAPWN